MANAAEILIDMNLVLDLMAKITANMAAAKDVLATSDGEQLRAKLALIQAQASAADAAFDAALAVAAG